MRTPLKALPGEDEIIPAQIIAIRRLYLAVLHRAIMDILNGTKKQKESAIMWVKLAKPSKPYDMIYLEDVEELINLSSTRKEKLHKLAKGVYLKDVFKAKRKASSY